MAPVFRDAGVSAPGNLNHALRSTFGKTLWRNGVPIEKVSELMGHEDTRTTPRYLALSQDDMADAMRVLNRVLPARQGGC
jgi:site-specific recombinase XerD